jgi:alpha-ketoglutarate-dependent taurine dioxygenase
MIIKDLDGFGSFGTVVDDVDLNDINDEEWNEIKLAHGKSLLTIIKLKKKLHYEKYYHLINNIGNCNQNFGDITPRNYVILKNFTVDPRFVHLQRVTALKDKRNLPLGSFDDGELLWHSNCSGQVEFVPGVALMGYQSMKGTATGFVQTADYYESLPESFKSELNDMVVIHNYQEATVNPVPVPEQESVYKLGFCPEQNTRIPLVIKSPSGVVGLHLGLNTFDYIEGMTKEESNNLVKKIKGELFVEKYIYDYWWENDQNILLFDNSITLHRRLLSKGTCGDRIAYRIPFRYESLYGYYEPYFQEEFNKIKKIKDNVL